MIGHFISKTFWRAATRSSVIPKIRRSNNLRKDDKTYDAVVRNLEIIGEAAKNIPEAARVKMAGIEWKKTAGLRDVIAHAYFGIDDAILWDVLRHKVPDLRQTIEMFYKNMPERDV